MKTKVVKRIDEEHDSERRQVWIATIADFGQAFLLPLGGTAGARADAEERDHFFSRSIPNRTDQWLFDVVSSVVPRLSDDEKPETLWKPILELGLERHHWVEMFLSSWFLTNKRIGLSDGFFREWRKMIHYAHGLANWRHLEFGRGRHESEKLFRYLMGFSDFGFVYIEEADYRSEIASLRSSTAIGPTSF